MSPIAPVAVLLVGFAALVMLCWFLQRAVRDLLAIIRLQDRRIAWLEDAERRRRVLLAGGAP